MSESAINAEVIGEGNPFKIRVTMPDEKASHEIAHAATIARLPKGCWVLEKYQLKGSEPKMVVAECHYRQLDFGDVIGPVEILVVGDEADAVVTKIDKSS